MNTGRRFFVMYGQTEAAPRMAYLPPDKTLEKCGSMGIAVPGGALKLIDETGTEITAPDTVGELVYHGSNVAMGYAECAKDLSKGDEWHGTLHTGDMAKQDSDGYFYRREKNGSSRYSGTGLILTIPNGCFPQRSPMPNLPV